MNPPAFRRRRSESWEHKKKEIYEVEEVGRVGRSNPGSVEAGQVGGDEPGQVTHRHSGNYSPVCPRNVSKLEQSCKVNVVFRGHGLFVLFCFFCRDSTGLPRALSSLLPPSRFLIRVTGGLNTSRLLSNSRRHLLRAFRFTFRSAQSHTCSHGSSVFLRVGEAGAAAAVCYVRLRAAAAR